MLTMSSNRHKDMCDVGTFTFVHYYFDVRVLSTPFEMSHLEDLSMMDALRAVLVFNMLNERDNLEQKLFRAYLSQR